MEATSTKMRRIMRDLHNKIGYFIVGLVIIYVFSGIIQTYRDTDLLKHEVINKKVAEPHLDTEGIGKIAKIKALKIDKTEGGIQYFKGGSYNTETGEVIYTTKEWYSWIKPFTELHKQNSKGLTHYFTVIFAIALFFMCISAFWMFKPGTKAFSSAVILTVLGIIAALLLVFTN